MEIMEEIRPEKETDAKKVPYEEIVIKEEPLLIDIDSLQEAVSIKCEKESPVVSQDRPTQPVIPLEVQSADTRNTNTLLISVCRICLEESLLQPIFPTEHCKKEKYDIAAKIAFVCPTLRKVKESDGYPQFICLSCATNLDVTFNFLQLAITSDRITSEFHPVPNGVLTKKPLLKPQVTNEHIIPHMMSPVRQSFRHKPYMAKDLTGEILYNFKVKRKRQRNAHQKVVYTSKDLPQKSSNKTNTSSKSQRSYSMMDRLCFKSWISRNDRHNLKLAQLSCITVVELHVDNVLYCLNCKISTADGLCSTCGPIKATLSVCRGCKKNYRRPVMHSQSVFLCLECRKDLIQLPLPAFAFV